MSDTDQQRVPPPQTAEKLYALITTPLDVTCPTPIEIIPNHVLRRPTEGEIARVRPFLGRLGGLGNYPHLVYEGRLEDDGTTLAHSDDPSEWRYWVIGVTESPGSSDAINEGLNDIQQASRITDVEIECPLVFFLPRGDGFMGPAGARNPFHDADPFYRPRRFDERALATLRQVYDGIRALGEEFSEVKRTIDNYVYLRAVPRNHPSYLLGVFGVIESLITHDPEGSFDSLGHQIKKKMALLDRRFDQPLDRSAFDPRDSGTLLWSRLYGLRSLIAHGKKVDFADNKLRHLKNAGVARTFLDSAAKALLRHALKEPQLVLDLREC
jgi:hypothetical protein